MPIAKDPAMLWYWSDWNSGTSTMSRFLKGCYMDVLHAQFNSGRLTLEEIRTVLGSDFGQAWPTLQKKFAVDEAGKYFNERLEIEKNKRAAFTASRRKNLESPHMNTHMVTHTAPRMENENVNTNGFGIELKLKESLDDLYLDGQRTKWSHVDFDFEYRTFCDKVVGSPDHYRNHDSSGLRLAFQSQLRGARKKTMSKPAPKLTLEDLNNA